MPPTVKNPWRRRFGVMAWASSGFAALAQAAESTLGNPRPGSMALPRERGLVVLLRHARTEPGVGDPAGYTLADCRSQRGLSDAGRAQAQRIGPALAAQGLAPTRVKSSRWCRCLDTARLAFGHDAMAWPALDSFFDSRQHEPVQTAALLGALAAVRAAEVEVWVTHAVNVAALCGEFLDVGQALVVRSRVGLGAGAGAGALPPGWAGQAEGPSSAGGPTGASGVELLLRLAIARLHLK